MNEIQTLKLIMHNGKLNISVSITSVKNIKTLLNFCKKKTLKI